MATWQGWRAIVFQRPLIQRTRLIENYANRKPGLVRSETKISWKGLSSLINWITVGNRSEGWQGCMEAQNLSGNFSCLFKSKKNSRRKEAVSLFAKMSPAVKQASTIQALLITLRACNKNLTNLCLRTSTIQKTISKVTNKKLLW